MALAPVGPLVATNVKSIGPAMAVTDVLPGVLAGNALTNPAPVLLSPSRPIDVSALCKRFIRLTLTGDIVTGCGRLWNHIAGLSNG